MTTIIPDQQQPLPRRSESGMHSRAINAAAGVLLAAAEQGRQFPIGVAIALDAAGLLNSPERAREFERMRQRLAEYERPVDEDPIAYALTDAATAVLDDAPALQLPDLKVICPYCAAQPGELCTSDGGTRPRRRDVHRHRTLAWQHAAEADGITRRIAPTQALTTGKPFVPRTEREYWVDIADALNAAHAVGMPVGIDLDGTLTDHRAWSVVWDRTAEQWTVAGYDDDAPATEDPCHPCGCPKRFNRHAWGCPTLAAKES